MNEPTEPGAPPPEELREAVPAPRSRFRPSLVWLTPVVAALIALWLVARAFLDAGPEITVTFRTAEGLEIGRTPIKYRSLDVGTVSAIDLTDDRAGVVVTARMKPNAAPLLVDDTSLWVVRPRVALAGVSGLGTLLAGSHIALDAGKSKDRRRAFAGLETPPAIPSDEPGRPFVLRSRDPGSLDVGSPVYFRRFRVGQVTSIAFDREGVSLRVFIRAPYDGFVTTGVRFWNDSGVDLAMDATGFRLDTQALMSLVVGGLAFELPPRAEPGVRAPPGTEFTAFADRRTAMRRPDIATDTYVLRFSGSVRGLSDGAPVDFLGMNIGEVTDISVDFDRAAATFGTMVEIDIHPGRLRSRGEVAASEAPPSSRDLLDQLVKQGLRGQLRTGNLLTGQLYVALDFFPDAQPVNLDWARRPIELPTMRGGLEQLQGSLARVLAKIDRLPTERLSREAMAAVGDLRTVLRNSGRLVSRMENEVPAKFGSLLTEATRALGSANQVLARDAPLQADLRRALADLGRAARSLRAFTDYLERHPESLLRGKRKDAK